MSTNPKLKPLPESVIEGYDEDTAWAVGQAVMNLLELVASTVRDGEFQERDELFEEAKKTIGMFSAAIILADGECRASELAFILHLLDMRVEPDSALRKLNDWSGEWESYSRVVPRFFRKAVKFGNGGQMLREIQFIGNNVCITDGDFDRKEQILVSHYVEFLEGYADTEEQVKA